MVLGSGQSVGRPQVVGNERRLRGAVAREVVVVHRKDDDILEIEVARLEDSHDLNAFERLPLVGNAQRLQVAAQQRDVDLRRGIDRTIVQRVAKPCDLLGNDGQKFRPQPGIVPLVGLTHHGGDHLREPVGEAPPVGSGPEDKSQQVVLSEPGGIHGDSPLARNLLLQLLHPCGIASGQIGMRQQSDDIHMVERAARALRPAVVLQLDEAFDKGIGQARTQRITHRYVDTSKIGRQRVQQRQQQVLVRQHDGRLLAQGTLFGETVENRRHILALHGIRAGRHGGKLLLL